MPRRSAHRIKARMTLRGGEISNMGNLALAVGIHLSLVSTADGGRSGPVLNLEGRHWSYRPNWGLPSMTPPEQTGGPVFSFSRPEIAPGESCYAVIVPIFPEMQPTWRREAVPGAVLPMYEGSRVSGHGRVLHRFECHVPISEEDEARFQRWLDDPCADSSQA